MFLSGPCDQQLWERVGIWGASMQYTGEQNSREPFLLSGQLSMSAGSIWVRLVALFCLVSDCGFQCASLFFWRGPKPAGLDLLKLPQCIRRPSRGAILAHPQMPLSMFSVAPHLKWKMLNRFIQKLVSLSLFEEKGVGGRRQANEGCYKCVCVSVCACVWVCVYGQAVQLCSE